MEEAALPLHHLPPPGVRFEGLGCLLTQRPNAAHTETSCLGYLALLLLLPLFGRQLPWQLLLLP